MKLYMGENVLEAGLARIRRLYDEFPLVVVNFSGGKDSTVVLNLTLQVAAERGRLPVHVFFLDQEAEWRTVIEYIRRTMHDPRVSPLWFQGEFKITNATSGSTPWLYCWKRGDVWMRDKEPDSIHENNTGADRFHEMFEAFSRSQFGNQLRAHINGVRTEESPARLRGLTSYATYKDITWGNAKGKKHNQYTFSPIYDWALTDVWKAIHEHEWPYCRIYDLMYQHGVPLARMRVSNLHHEGALEQTHFLQDIEPDTWNRLTDRLAGVNAVSKLRESYKIPPALPPMFTTWEEYRDYLVDHLIEDPKVQDTFRRQFASWGKSFEPEAHPALVRMEVSAVLINDHEGTKYSTFVASHGQYLVGRGARGRVAKR